MNTLGLALTWACNWILGPGPATGSWALGPSWWGWAAGGTDLAFSLLPCVTWDAQTSPSPGGTSPPKYSRAGTPHTGRPPPPEAGSPWPLS